MRRINYGLFFLTLPLFILILGCGTDEGDTLNPEPKSDEVVLLEEVLVTYFLAQKEGADITEFYTSSDEPVVITEGESVTFENRSHYSRLFSDESIATEEYWGATDWTFEGGSPNKSAKEIETVLYSTPGTYDVSLGLIDLGKPQTLTVSGYVIVIARNCPIKSEESSDGRSTEFIYENNLLIRADKLLNENLQEFSLYSYDSSERLEKEEFMSPQDELLGFIGYEYNDSNHIILEKTEAADGTLIRDRTFTWNDDEDYIISAVYREPDGLGGLATFDVAYVYDSDKHNITNEVFTQNGVGVGQNNYEFDNSPKVFYVIIEPSPLKFNRNNATSITALDASGTVIRQQTSTFDYGNDEESCGRPISETRTTNGTETFYKFYW